VVCESDGPIVELLRGQRVQAAAEGVPAVHARQLSVRCSERRVDTNGFVQKPNDLMTIVGSAGTEVGLAGARVDPGGDRQERVFPWCQVSAQLAGHFASDLVLQPQKVTQIPPELTRPLADVPHRVYELEDEPHAVALGGDRTLQNGPHTQLLPDLLGRTIRVAVPHDRRM